MRALTSLIVRFFPGTGRFCPGTSFFLGILLIVAPLGAQYNPPGSSVETSELPAEEGFREQMEGTQLRLGVLRLQPWIGVRDASFVSTSETNDETDFTVSLGAGLRAYMKAGQNWIVAAHALPEYNWWRSDEARRGVGGRFGAGLFAYYNRLNMEVSLRRSEIQRFFSSEIQELATQRRDTARLGFELDLAGQTSLQGSHVRTRSASQEEDLPIFARLDNETEETRLGLLYQFSRKARVSVGIADSSLDFAEGARNLSHTGTAGWLAASYEGPRFDATLGLELQSLDPQSGSDFASVDVTTGFLETTWSLHRSVDLFLYGRRSLHFSVRGESSHFLAERLGARIQFGLGASELSLMAELGEDDFQGLDQASPSRADDVTAFGALLSFDLVRVLRLNVGLIHTDYDSPLSELDRDVTAWTATVQLTSLKEKFRFGDADQIW